MIRSTSFAAPPARDAFGSALSSEPLGLPLLSIPCRCAHWTWSLVIPVSTGLCRQGLGQSFNSRQIRLQIRVPSAPVDPQQVHGRLADSRSTALHYPVPRQPSSCTLLQHLLGGHSAMPCLCILGNFVAALVPPLVGSLRCRLV